MAFTNLLPNSSHGKDEAEVLTNVPVDGDISLDNIARLVADLQPVGCR